MSSGDDLAVDLGAAAAVAEVGVQRVGEIHRRRAGRQVDHLALRREHVDGVVERRAPRLRPVAATSSRHARSWRSQAIFCSNALRVPSACLLLVAPVRGDAVLGLAVHLLGADLHFERPAPRAEHRGMQRLVEVALGPRDVVVELLAGSAARGCAPRRARRSSPSPPARSRAARARRSTCGEVEALAAHLVPDGIDVLGPAGDLGLHARRPSARARATSIGVRDVLLALEALLVEHLRDASCTARARGSGTTDPPAPT